VDADRRSQYNLASFAYFPARKVNNMTRVSQVAASLALVAALGHSAGAQSTLYKESYRPQFHFTSETNWLNDPNGLVYYNGEYHLFFQHNPTGINWGNMTWGHAISTDLMHWTQLDNAISPDANGDIFSGSAVIDKNNSAGFGTNAMVAMFTYSGSTLRTQGIAYSTDNGRTFTKYPSPVLGQYNYENRDPRVFWYHPANQWRMALYMGTPGAFAIFGSSNLKTWTNLSSLSFPGGAETPDMYEIALDGDPGNTRWIFSQADGHYMVGQFDGTTFTPAPQIGVQQIEWGYDPFNSYGGQTFNNEPNGRRVSITWMAGGEYPGMPFNQQMSIPRELTLRGTPSGGAQLYQMPVAEVASLRREASHWTNTPLVHGTNLLAGLSGALFDIDLEIRPGSAKTFDLTLRGNTLHYDVATKQLTLAGKSMAVQLIDGVIKLRVLEDITSLEVFANDGAATMSYCFVPDLSDLSLSLTAQGGAATVNRLDVYEMDSIWFPTPVPEPSTCVHVGAGALALTLGWARRCIRGCIRDKRSGTE
jgi:fructan beta-fructosidase